MKYLAIEIKGDIHVLNNTDELGGLIDNDVPHTVLGTVCDNRKFGDNCSTDCLAYAKGVCRATIVRDINNQLWHCI